MGIPCCANSFFSGSALGERFRAKNESLRTRPNRHLEQL
jgi:hypothetical protein